MSECSVHPGVDAVRTCTVCGREYCTTCFISPEDQICRYCRNRVPASTTPSTPTMTTIVPKAGSQVGHESSQSQTALVALIVSIAGLVLCCCGVLSIVSLILAIMAKKELKTHPGMQGEGMATAAFWISIVGIVLAFLLFSFMVVCMALGFNAGNAFQFH